MDILLAVLSGHALQDRIRVAAFFLRSIDTTSLTSPWIDKLASNAHKSQVGPPKFGNRPWDQIGR
jgi:hypothetical protein